MFICQSTILKEALFINNITNDFKRNTEFLTKTPYCKPTFRISKNTNEQQKFLTMFNFQHSHINQQKFDRLAELFLKYQMVYATPKFDVERIHSPLHLVFKLDAIFKKQQTIEVPIH